LAREQRRLAAILAADVAGYSRLMGRDESGTLARLKAHRTERLEPALARHGGRLVKLTGDGALAEFPSAVDALGAAIEFQQAMTDANRDQPADTAIVFRIGLHLGDLIVDGEDLYGDGVNVAARLEAEAPAGGIVISHNVHDAVVGRLKARFDDLGSLALKNIERPMQAFSVKWEAPDWKVSAPVVAAPSIAVPLDADVPLALPDKPSIAVLPFQNMSGDPEQEYFADGMTEDLITLLSQTLAFVVISNNSSSAYKDKSIDRATVARQLDVSYLVEGSVRRAANRIRVTAHLVEAQTGNRVWSDHFDREISDIFAVQDDVTSAIVGALHPQLLAAEVRSRRSQPRNLDAWGLVVRGMMALISLTQENLNRARVFSTQAIETAPDYGLAHGVRAFALGYQAYTQWGPDWYADAKQSSDDIKRTLTLASDDPTALFLVGGASLFMARHRTGVSILERAVQLNPNLAMARSLLGLGYASLGKAEEGLENIKQALRLSPRDPMAYLFHAAEALCYFVAGNYPNAVSAAEKGLNINAESIDNRLYLAATMVGLGKMEDAKHQIARVLRIAPNVRLSTIGNAIERGNSGWVKYHGALRKAGLPE
jgi:adenylate cyclase